VTTKGLGQRAIVFESPAALEDLLRGGLILPEVRRRARGLDLVQFPQEACFVKGPSANR
jgi:hypothetical protein